eukprot:796509-Pelagomonas_calceolata.AAC.1
MLHNRSDQESITYDFYPNAPAKDESKSTQFNWSCLVNPCCVLGLHVCAHSQQNSTPMCPDPPTAPPSLQVAPDCALSAEVATCCEQEGGCFWGRSKVSYEKC